MANGDNLRRIFRAWSQRDDVGFREAAEEIIKEEHSKNHRLLAEDLQKLLLNGSASSSELRRTFAQEIPKDKEKGLPLLDITNSSKTWENLILSAKHQKVLKQITKEHQKTDLLKTFGLLPKRRILFYGPPGCGKTLGAQVMAGELGYPLVTVRFDAVVSSYLGETAANLRRVFDFVQRGRWVVLFDDFDAIGKDRDNHFEHGELKRVVNTLLQLMDLFSGDSLLIAATNHESLLDSAVWRRFEVISEFPLPMQQDRLLMLKLFLKAFNVSKELLTNIARRTNRASGSDIELIAIEAARQASLDNGREVTKNDIEAAFELYTSRLKATQITRKQTKVSTKKKGK